MEGEDRRPRGPADEVAAEAGETARRRRVHVSGGGGGQSRGRRCPRRCGRWSRGMEGEDRRPRGPADEVAAEAGETARRRREETATAAVAAEKGAAA